MTASRKEQRRRDCARRHWRSYRGRAHQRQRLPGLAEPRRPDPCADKTLMRLNFLGALTRYCLTAFGRDRSRVTGSLSAVFSG